MTSPVPRGDVTSRPARPRALFLLHQRGQQDNEPLVPFSLSRDRNFTLVNILGIAISFGVVGLFLPITVYLQSVLGYSAVKAGLVLLPLSIGSFVTAGPATVLATKVGGRCSSWVVRAVLASGLCQCMGVKSRVFERVGRRLRRMPMAAAVLPLPMSHSMIRPTSPAMSRSVARTAPQPMALPRKPLPAGLPREWYIAHNRRLKTMRLAIALLDSGVYEPSQAGNRRIRDTAELIGVRPPSDLTCRMVRVLLGYGR